MYHYAFVSSPVGLLVLVCWSTWCISSNTAIPTAMLAKMAPQEMKKAAPTAYSVRLRCGTPIPMAITATNTQSPATIKARFLSNQRSI